MFSEGDWSTTPIKLPLMPKPKGIQVCCVGDARLFWSLIWHFMANGIVFKFDASHHAVVNLLGVDTMSSRRSHLLKLQKQGARLALPCCACCVIVLLKSLHPGRLRNTCNPADVLQAVPWTALVREENCFIHTTQLNIWVECKFRIVHHAMSREVPLQFVKVLRWLDQWD